jgi:hypothetical protein
MNAPADDVVAFRPNARRRNRVAAGVALVAIAVAANVAIYASLDSSSPAVQATRDILAGELITADALRTVEVDVGDSVPVVPGGDLDVVVGQYAKVRIGAGSLLAPNAVQPRPLIAEGASVVAIKVPEGSLPVGVRERVPVLLVIPSEGTDAAVATTVTGRVIGLPSDTTTVTGLQTVTVEVAAADAATVAAADDVRVVLIDPAGDPGREEES